MFTNVLKCFRSVESPINGASVNPRCGERTNRDQIPKMILIGFRSVGSNDIASLHEVGKFFKSFEIRDVLGCGDLFGFAIMKYECNTSSGSE